MKELNAFVIKILWCTYIGQCFRENFELKTFWNYKNLWVSNLILKIIFIAMTKFQSKRYFGKSKQSSTIKKTPIIVEEKCPIIFIDLKKFYFFFPSILTKVLTYYKLKIILFFHLYCSQSHRSSAKKSPFKKRAFRTWEV